MSKALESRPRAHRVRLGPFIAAVLLSAGAAHASYAGPPGSTAEQRLREDLRGTMTELVQSGAFGERDPRQISLDMDVPAQRVSDLGLIVDSAQSGNGGLHVLGVTPGGSAERMGLQAGDVLVALNGTALQGTQGATTLRDTIQSLPSGSRVEFEVRRDGRIAKLAGTANSVDLPAMHLSIGDPGSGSYQVANTAETGCGRISDFDAAPRQQQLHGAKIISIDGTTPGPSTAKAFRVEAGQHVLKVAERIESRYLSFSDRLRNTGRTDQRYKTLTVDVEPNTTVLIAARLNPDKATDWQDGGYWDPVAWKQVAETCR